LLNCAGEGHARPLRKNVFSKSGKEVNLSVPKGGGAKRMKQKKKPTKKKKGHPWKRTPWGVKLKGKISKKRWVVVSKRVCNKGG